MFKSILVPLTGHTSDDATLETAYLVARMFDAHLHCLHVRPGWPELLSEAGAQFAAETGPSDEFIEALEKVAKSSAWRANRHFAEFCRRWRVPLCDAPPAPQGVSASWREELGDALRTIVERARVHDLVVVGRPPEENPLSAPGIGEILIAAGRPLLLAPAKAPENLAPTVAIAWKNCAEAARATMAAMPMLAKADKVVVLSAAEGDDTADALKSADALALQLRWHGIKPESFGVSAAGRTAADAVLDMARASGADMLVMGGYGHARLREFIFGGFTRQVLRECRLPVFLFH